MVRRGMIASILGGLASFFDRSAQAQPSDQNDNANQELPFDFKNFKFEHVTTTGAEALAELERQKSRVGFQAIILGGDEDMSFITSSWVQHMPPDPSAILKRADDFGGRFDIKAFRVQENANRVAKLKESGTYIPTDEDYELLTPEAGEWPETPEVIMPTVNIDILKGVARPKVYIALIPTSRNDEIPAYFGWGNWNGNPPAEVHVAMLRRWNRKYGAELIGMTGDVLNMKIKRRPTTKDEALALALEQFLYCEDLVFQGTETLEALAGALMVSDHWYFWWD